MNKQFGLRFGAISDPIEKQLEEQGLKLPNCDRYQAQADRISHLNVGRVLTDSEAAKARQRLLKMISSEVVSNE